MTETGFPCSTGTGDDDLSGAFYKGENLTNREYRALLAQAEANSQEVVNRTELGKQHRPSDWVRLGRDNEGVMWEGRAK